MKTRSVTLEVTQDITNPSYDKRCRWNIKGIKTIPAGTRIRAAFREETIEIGGTPTHYETVSYDIPSDDGYGTRHASGNATVLLRGEGKYESAQDKLVRLLLTNTREVNPRRFRDIAHRQGCSNYEGLAADVMDRILADNLMTVDQVAAIIDALLADTEA